MFQSTRPRGARLESPTRIQAGLAFQSTRPRGARQRAQIGCYNYIVSIHAPTRGATSKRKTIMQPPQRFNPRAHAGRDNGDAGLQRRTERINPRAHAGRDWRVCAARCLKHVSIHAPTRGATWHIKHMYLISNGFNPRAHAGRDPKSLNTLIGLRSFNPRAHAGRDCNPRPIFNQRVVSIHAPTRGATEAKANNDTTRTFQSTRPRGARLREFSHI